MSEPRDFFRAGGALPQGTQSYLLRRADGEIIDALLAGEFVFVLDSRQKGKSSLIVRSLQCLHDRGVTPIRIDLQSLGANLTPEQWYGGLLHSLGQELGLTPKLWDFWKANTGVGPMARWFLAIEAVILPDIQTPMVIFVDEVDFVRSLPFSTDEFFAGIRECFNRRATSPEFNRLTFCLVGVAAPSQLIKNEELTPFNVGRRVELTDFTRTELEPYSRPLSNGERDGRRLLDRIFYWVGGHPYLTQLLASSAAQEAGIHNVRDIDRLVHRTLMSADARQKEPNVADVERRLLEAVVPGSSLEESRSQVLDLYRLLLRGDASSANWDGALLSVILLSGVAVEDSARLRVRNRLYRTLFDEQWRRANLPDAEMRRQKAASARAAWRVAWISMSILLLLSVLFLRLLTLTHDRDLALANSKRLNRINLRNAYEASIALAWERIEDGNFIKAFDLVHSQNGSPDRGWEWRFLTTLFTESKELRPDQPLAPLEKRTVLTWREQGSVIEVKRHAIFRDGKPISLKITTPYFYSLASWLEATQGARPFKDRVALAEKVLSRPSLPNLLLSDDARLLIGFDQKKNGFDLISPSGDLNRHVPTNFSPYVICVTHNGRQVLLTDDQGNSYLYDIGRRTWVWESPLGQAGRARISPDNRFALIPRASADSLVVRMADGVITARLVGHASPAMGYAWFKDSKRAITCSSDGSARIWNTVDGRQIRQLLSPGFSLRLVDLDAREHSALLVGLLGSQLRWDFDRRPTIQTLAIHRNQILSCTLSPDGTRGVTSSMDGTSAILNLVDANTVAKNNVGVPGRAHPVCFSRNGDLLAEVEVSGRLDFVDPKAGAVLRCVPMAGTHPQKLTIAADGRVFLALTEGGIATMASWRAEPVFHATPGQVGTALCLSADQTKLAIGTKSGEIALLDSVTLKQVGLLNREGGLITHVEFSPDGRWLAASSHDSNVYMFALDGSNKKHVLSGHWSRVWGASFSPDGRKLLTNSYDATARIWDVESGSLVAMLQHSSWVSSAYWSPDGQRIVTSCADGYVRVFDPLDGFELLKLSGSKGPVLDARFTPDGKTLISAGADGSVRFWRSTSS